MKLARSSFNGEIIGESKNLLGLREDQSPITKSHKQVVPGGVVGILSLVYVHVGDYVVVMLVPYYIVDCAKQADQELIKTN